MEEFKELINTGNVKEALDWLGSQNLNKGLRKKLNVLRFGYQEYKDSRQKLLLSREDEIRELNRIVDSLLQIFEEYKNAKSLQSDRDTKVKNYKKPILFASFIAVIIFLSIGLISTFSIEKSSDNNHCIVAKSFAVYSNAERYQKQLVADGYKNAEIVVKKGGEVYVTCFTVLADKQEAIFELEKLKIHERENEIWIYSY